MHTNDKVTIYATIKFKDIICQPDVIGTITPVVIGGIGGSLRMPRMPEIPKEFKCMPCLLHPLPDRDGFLDWGSLNSVPPQSASVEKILLEFLVNKHEGEAVCNIIHEHLSNWRSLFVNYIQLYTRNKHKPLVIDSLDNLNMDIVMIDGDHKSRPYQRILAIHGVCLGGKEGFDNNQLQAICNHCSSSTKPALAYQMLLEAYQALQNQDHRKAVIDAGTAAEVALTKVIKSKLPEEPYAEIILKAYQTLGGRLKLAKKVAIELPKTQVEYEEILVVPRNKAAHGGAETNPAIAYKAVVAAEELLGVLLPSIAETSDL